jgi:hypothetical protein
MNAPCACAGGEAIGIVESRCASERPTACVDD